MNIYACQYIGFEKKLQSEGETFSAYNPATGESLSPRFSNARSEEINEAIEKAERAFRIYRNVAGSAKAEFLETIAEEIMALGDDLLHRCNQETGLPLPRLQGERGRTIGQLKMFANILREGSWVDARIDTALPDRQPLPRPDLRSMQVALGPVGIFGASNFPLAFSVAGGDTVSALAAGCPVIVKAHPAHPGTSDLVAQAILLAAQKCNMPDGIFSMVQGVSNAVGMAIVSHPLIKAIGFTGSYRGGKALYDEAQKRPEPIPVYAEMGSVNPVFILPDALESKLEAIAQGLFASVTLGVGQFCTNPGLAFVMDTAYQAPFREALSAHFRSAVAGTMLTQGIYQNYHSGIAQFSKQNEVELLAAGTPTEGPFQGVPSLFATKVNNWLQNPLLEEEIFGPSTLLITANDKAELLNAVDNLHGHLTATVHGTENDLLSHRELLDSLSRKVGRLLINGFPTGVEVCRSMVHGGPYPATSDARMTSVGGGAITRFTRPLCFQNYPQFLLPEELKNENGLGIMRWVNDELSRSGI